jgi:hypothetical protein
MNSLLIQKPVDQPSDLQHSAASEIKEIIDRSWRTQGVSQEELDIESEAGGLFNILSGTLDNDCDSDALIEEWLTTPAKDLIRKYGHLRNSGHAGRNGANAHI